MKIIKDKKKLLKNINENFRNDYIIDIEDLLEMIIDHYDIADPILENVNYGYDLELMIKDKEYDLKSYNVIVSMNTKDNILVEVSNANYIDSFKLSSRGFIRNNKRIYKNSKNNETIEKTIFAFDKKYLELEKYYKEEINDFDETIINTIKVNYEGYEYHFKNNYLDSEIRIEIPHNYPFVEDFFIKKIFESNIEITNINILFYVIKKVLNCSKAIIKIQNHKEKGYEIIHFENNELKRYRKIDDDKMIEYKEGARELLITRFEKDTIENKEFQKVLKMIRS